MGPGNRTAVKKDVGEAALRGLVPLAAQADARRADEAGTLVVATAALIEGYVDAVLRGLIETTPYEEHAFVRTLFAELEDRIFQSWAERFRWLRDGFDVSLEGTAELQSLSLLIELRNACVHGSASLTDRQSRNLTSLLALEKDLARLLGVAVIRRKLYFGDDTAIRAARVARDFITLFDERLADAHPGVVI